MPAHEKGEVRKPLLVAIVGGSGAGKSWLAQQLEQVLGGHATRLSQDDFYHDRSHLSPAQRARINYDHPRTIDWAALERVLRRLRAGQAARGPCYDFSRHCRSSERRVLVPKPVILVEGLWLLRRPALRRWFALRVFVDCSQRTRLSRRLARDCQSRGRTEASIRAQFRTMVEPMHRKFVAPQARWADVVLRAGGDVRQVRRLAAILRKAAQLKHDA